MGLLDWMRARSKGKETAKPSRTHSIFSDFPDRVLKTQADVKKDDALLEMTMVVNEISNDPDTNWRKYKGDFEKAVTGMREAFNGPEREKNMSGSNPPVPIDVVWESGNIRRQAREPQENQHFTIYTKGLIGKSTEGVHHRVDIGFVAGDFDGTDYMRGDWSHAAPTQDAAMREMKAAMVTEDRKAAEWTGQDSGSGSQSIAAVNKAIKEGRAVNLDGKVSRSENAQESNPKMKPVRKPSVER